MKTARQRIPDEIVDAIIKAEQGGYDVTRLLKTIIAWTDAGMTQDEIETPEKVERMREICRQQERSVS